MTRWKRSRIIYLALEDEKVFSLEALLQGRVESSVQGRLCLFDLLNSRRVPVDLDLLQFLKAVPSDKWVEPGDVPVEELPDSEAILRLVESGWLLTQGSSEPERRGRALDEGLEDGLWHSDALFFHRMARLHPDRQTGEFAKFDIEDVVRRSASSASEFVERHGEPPSAHFAPEGVDTPSALPDVDPRGEIFDLLRRRRTVRSFDPSRPLSKADLSSLLRYTFGRFGEAELAPGLTLFKKGSPSGGGLHPVEAFPLLLNAEGFEPGLYHYDTVHHHLTPVTEPMAKGEVRELAQRIAAGQLYVGEAGVLVLMVARFLRNHWKYRKQSRTYSVMLMDAGHLSQTFYLLATQLGLGAFFSGAINLEAIEAVLPLPPEAYGPLGVCGCGNLQPNGGAVPNHGGLNFGAPPTA